MTVVFWDDSEWHGFVMEPAERFEETKAAVAVLKGAATVGEVRSTSLPGWAEDLATSIIESLEDEGPVQADTVWPVDDATESVTDVVPVPWDARSVADWFGAERLATYAEIGGASPGGHIDTYTVRDREELFSALQAEGYTPEHRQGLVDAYYQVL